MSLYNNEEASIKWCGNIEMIDICSQFNWGCNTSARLTQSKLLDSVVNSCIYSSVLYIYQICVWWSGLRSVLINVCIDR